MHALEGKPKGYQPATVKANWRIIFRFEGGDVYDAALIDDRPMEGEPPCR